MRGTLNNTSSAPCSIVIFRKTLPNTSTKENAERAMPISIIRVCQTKMRNKLATTLLRRRAFSFYHPSCSAENGESDSAITKSRTLLEEVFCYVIEKKGEIPSESGNIGKLYNQVKTLYSMQQSKDYDKRVNGLLSGLEKILTAIAEMRNIASDSHGMGVKRIRLPDYYARLFVNSAATMAEFVLAVENNRNKIN